MNKNEDIEPTEEKVVRPRRRQERATQTRKNIIDAATAEFAAVGYDGTTTRSIAERAGIPYGLVVYHFKSKLGAWQAVMENLLHAFHIEFQTRMKELEGCDDATRLRESQRAFIRLSARKPELNLLMAHETGEGAKGAERFDWLSKNIVGNDSDIAIDLIRKVQRLGLYVAGDPAHLHMMFVIVGSRIFALSGEIRRTMNQSPFSESFVEEHIALCERLFWREPERSKPRRESFSVSRKIRRPRRTLR